MNTRNLFAFPAMAALLGACSGLVQVGPPAAVTITSTPVVESQFVTAQELFFNGVRFPAGTDVICDNLTTGLNYSFSFAGNLERFDAVLVDGVSGVVTGALVPGTVLEQGNVVTVTNAVVNPGLLLSKARVGSQAAISVPPSTVRGVTQLRVTVFDGLNDVQPDDFRLSESILVAGNCV